MAIWLAPTGAWAVCPPASDYCAPGPTCTISSTNKTVPAGCIVDFGTTALTITGVLKSASPGQSFGIKAGSLILDGGKLSAAGGSSSGGGGVTVELGTGGGTGSFTVKNNGSVDVTGTPGGGSFGLNGGAITLMKGSLSASAGSGPSCGDGGSISLTGTEAFQLQSQASISATAGGACSGGSVDVTGSSVSVGSTIDISGGSPGSIAIYATGNAPSGDPQKDIQIATGAQLKANGSGDESAAGGVTLWSQKGNLTLDGTISAITTGAATTGGSVELTAASQVTINGPVTLTAESGGSISIESTAGAAGVSIASTSTLNANGTLAGGSITVDGINGTIAGSLTAAGTGATAIGGSMAISFCSVTVSGTLDVHGAVEDSGMLIDVSGRTVTITSTAHLTATPCSANDCNTIETPVPPANISPSAVIDPPPNQVAANLPGVCCGNGVEDDPTEECDDGNAFYCDSCRPDCTDSNAADPCPADSNLCTVEYCDDARGCLTKPYTGCPDDHVSCTQDCDPAPNVGCTHKPIDLLCDDHNACTENTCNPSVGDPVTGCTFPALPNGESCFDTNACTIGDTCQAGTCTSGSGVLCCDDGNPCTVDSCDPVLGCLNTEPSTPCPCQTPGGGCSDGNQATIGDHCDGLNCISGPLWSAVCGDGNPCTNDFFSLSHPSECTHTPSTGLCATSCVGLPDHARCNDGTACTVGECLSEICVPTSYQCGDADPSNGLEYCIPRSGVGQPGCQGSYPAAFCGSTCGNGQLEPGEECDDGNTVAGDCCSAACQFEAYGSPCTGSACTTGEFCAAGACGGGSAVTCNDNNSCTTDTCSPASGCVFTNNAPCNDSNPCTTDTCNPASGCVFTNNTQSCNDNNLCTANDVCSGGTCGGTTITCNDNKFCTTDSCNPASGCVFTNNTLPCSDGNSCTSNDTCSGGTCIAGTTITCNDNNVCTTDTCNPASGCVFTNNTIACDDNNVCSGGDTCSGGVCQGTTCALGGPCGPGCSSTMTCQTDASNHCVCK